MKLNRSEWLTARARHHRATIEEIERQIKIMQDAEFSLHDRTDETPNEPDITHQVIAHERQLIVELSRIIGFIESKIPSTTR